MLTLFLHAALASELDTSRAAGAGAGAPSGVQAAAPGTLSSLDFINASDRAEVVLGLGDASAPTAAQRGQVVTVSLPGVTVPAAHRRPLDTSFFAAPVLGIQAGGAAGAGVVQVTVRQGAAWELVEGEPGFWRLVVRYGEHGVAYSGQTVVTRSDDSAAAALEAALAPGSGGAGARINLDLVDADVHNVLRLIAEVADVNIVTDDSVSGSVTLRLVDVPWQDALQAVLASKGLAATWLDDAVVVGAR
jgi:type IV pilus assembly protein PilQ